MYEGLYKFADFTAFLPSTIHILYHIEHLNPLYPGRLFHWYMLEESVCNFRGVRSILSLLFYFMMENPV